MRNINLDLSKDEFLLFLDGNQHIFRTIFDQYHGSLYRYVQSLSPQSEEVDDIIQQCFVQLFRYKTSIKNAQGIYPYLLVIAKRLVIMAFRKQVLEARYQKETVLNAQTHCLKTENQVDFNELQTLLLRFIEMLPPQQREIYRLNKIDGYSCDEISAVMGRSRHTIKNQLVTASKKIKLLISSCYMMFIIFYILLN